MGKKFITYNGTIVGNGGLTLLSVETSNPTPPPFTNTKSIALDGVDDYVDVGYIADLNNASAFTYSGWYKQTTIDQERFLMGFFVTSGNWFGLYTWSDGNMYIHFKDGGVNKYGSFDYSTLVTANDWFNIVIVFNGSGSTNADRLKCYIDGTQATLSFVGTQPTTTPSGANNLTLGKLDGFPQTWLGKSDELALWNTDESANITSIYNSGVPNNLNDLSTPPLSWWRCGDGDTVPTLTDNGTGGNDGTMTNFSTFSTDVPPNPFTNTLSTSFDGIDDYVDCGNDTSLQPTNFTMCLWVKPFNNTSNRALIQNGAGLYGNSNHGFFLQQSYGNYYFKIGDGTTSYTSFNGGLVANTWQFLTLSYDGVNMKSYLDGVLQDTLAVPNITYGTSATWNPFYIGRTSGGSQYMDGNIDEVSLFNTALTQTDITTIYNSGIPNNISGMSGLVSFWRMGDGSTYPTINDVIGSNDGTMTNMSSANFVTDVPFNYKSILLDGVDDYINVADNSNLSFGNGVTDSPFSISTWVKMDDATKFRAVGKYGASNIEYVLATGGDDKLIFNCYDNSEISRIGRKYFTPMNSYQGQWIHIVGTYNGNSSSSGLKIYLNGVRVDDTDSNSGTYVAMENTTQPLYIGKLTTSYSDGLIDETAIFNSELSASDVTTIYNGGEPNDISSLSPLSWWRCGDGDTAPTLTDNGSASNDGTMTNFSTFSTDVP